MKKFVLIICVTTISLITIKAATEIAVEATTGFEDDQKIQSYSRPYVESLVSAGGISGYTDNTFKPQGTISRVEFLSMCVNSLCDLEQFVNNIDTDIYDETVEKYGFNEIWNGSANDVLVIADSLGLSREFSNDASAAEWSKPISRAEAADMIYNCLNVLKKEKLENSAFGTSSIRDWQDIKNSGYEESIKAVYSAGIVQGDAKGFFHPMNSLTREDSAILICKALDKQKREIMKPITEPKTQEVSSQATTQTSSLSQAQAARQALLEMSNGNSVVVGERGVKSIKNFIKTAFEPLGNVMYIYGGGWNEADTGAGKEAMTLGLSQSWIDFSKKQNASYNSSNYDYKKNVSVIHNGLDCSGYVGWIIYNVMNDGKGYVTYSYKMDDMLAAAGYGKIYKRNTYTERRPGDIMASGCNDCKHIYVCLGQCGDGSVLLLHSSPPGVQLTGTYTPQGNKNSEAIKLANEYMQKYYPEWHKKYPDSSRNTSYITHYDKFEWSVLSDAEGYRNMTPSQVLKDIFGE